MRNCTRMLMIIFVAASLWGCADAKPKKDLNIERSGMVSTTATVKAVDMETRVVTLRAPGGRTFKIRAGKEVVNLPQVKVGDEVVAVYSEALAVRMARPGEVREDISQEVGRAKPGSKPGAYEVIETTVTAKIEDIDKTGNTATLRMPDGDVLIVKVQDPANLEKVREGDTIVITYREALVVSMEKAKK